MNSITLPRISVPVLQDIELPVDLLRRAFSALGYQYSSPGALDTNLVRLLSEFGVAPFEPTAVRAYKKAMFKKHKANWLTRITTLSSERVAWRMTPISIYRDPIPVSVLDTAIELSQKAKWPIEFRVEHLGTFDFEKAHEEYMKTYDPFLIVRVSRIGPWHHIAVWDEPTFKG